MENFVLDFKLKNVSEIDKTAKKLDQLEGSINSNIEALKKQKNEQNIQSKAYIQQQRAMEAQMSAQLNSLNAQRAKIQQQILENGSLQEGTAIYEEYTNALRNQIDIKESLEGISKNIVKAQKDEITSSVNLQSQIDKLQKSIDNEADSHEELTSEINNSAKASKESVSVDKNKEQSVKSLTNSLDAIKNAQESFANSVKNTRNIIIGATAAYVAIKSALALLEKGFQTLDSVNTSAANFEKFSLILENLEGSSQKAKQSMEWIDGFTSKTPIAIDELTEAFVKMRSYGLEPTNGLMETLSDTSLAMGKSLIQGVEAVADAMVGENERLKEFGIRASRGIDDTIFSWTDASGKSKGIIVKNNQEIITSTLEAIFNEKYAGQSKKMMDSYDGIQSQISSTFETMKRSFAENSGIFDNSKLAMEGFLQGLKELQVSADFADFTESMGESFESLLLNIGSITKGIGSSILFIRESFTAVGIAITAVQKIANRAAFEILDTSLAIRQAMALTEKSTKQIEELRKGIKEAAVTNDIKFNLDIKESIEGVEAFREKIDNVNDVINTLQNNISKKINDNNINKTLNSTESKLTQIQALSDIEMSMITDFNSLNSAKDAIEDIKKSLIPVTKQATSSVGMFASEDELKRQHSVLKNQKTMMLDFYKETKQDRLAFEEEIKHLEEEYKKEKGVSDEMWNQIEASRRKDFEESYLNDIVSKHNKQLNLESDYYKAINDMVGYKEAELSKYRNQLKLDTVKEGSAEYKALIENKEKEISKSIIDIQKQRRADEMQIQNEKISDQLAYYEKIDNVVKANELRLQQYKNSLMESDNLSDSQKNQMAQLEANRLAFKEKMSNYDKEIEKANLLGQSKEEQSLKEQQFIDELVNKKYTELEIEQALALYRKQNHEAYMQQINSQMGMQEAFNTQLQNSTIGLQNQLLTQGEMVASVLDSSVNAMTNGFENFFNGSKAGFMNLNDLVRNVAADMLKSLASVIAKQMAVQAASSIMGGFGGGFFADGGVFSGGQQVTAYAKGGAFTNSVASSPTLAPMALFGEAGPEAIMPLQRDASGRLGVAASSGGNGGTVVVENNVIINNNASNKVSVTESTDSNGNKQLTIEEIDERLSNLIRNGNSVTEQTFTKKYPNMK